MVKLDSSLQNLLALFLFIFLIIIIWYAFKTINESNLVILTQDVTWISILILVVVIIFNIEDIHQNELIIVLVIAIFIVMVAVQITALIDDTSNSDQDDK